MSACSWQPKAGDWKQVENPDCDRFALIEARCPTACCLYSGVVPPHVARILTTPEGV